MAKILVIEDNPTIRKEVLTWLRLEDYDVVGAANGREGVEMGLQHCPDLILADIMMPEKDGYRVLAELRAQPTTALIPFIFMTAKQEKVDIRYGMQLGADDYITKPFDREELLSTVRTRLERRNLVLQASDQKGRDLRAHLLHMLPHELRTPLVGILGISELLGQDAKFLTPEEITEYAGMITASGQQLYRLIENHLFCARLAIDAADPEWAGFVQNASTRQTLSIIRDTSEGIALAYRRALDLQLNLAHGIVRMTPEHLNKVVYELVDNAFKFSQAPVRVMSQIEADKYILTIADQGRGMTPENIAQIDVYMQFERKRYEQQGLGLGLIIARQLTELYGGSLQIKSKVGGGTVVKVSLKLA